MKIIERDSKGIITKSNLPDADYVINPYTGCTHGCLYCYAEFMRRFARVEAPWGEFIVVKNFPLPRISKTKYVGKKILISSVTDPYQPIEKKYQQMRKILPLFINSKAKIEILTKSSMILRDLDLLKKLDQLTVGISLSTLDDQFRKIIEPGASPVSERLHALKMLKEQGIHTYLFIAPIFPELTPLNQLIEKTANYIDFYLCENLNLRGSYKHRILKLIEKQRPDKLPLYKSIYLEKKPYWKEYAAKIRLLEKQIGKPIEIYFNHYGT